MELCVAEDIWMCSGTDISHATLHRAESWTVNQTVCLPLTFVTYWYLLHTDSILCLCHVKSKCSMYLLHWTKRFSKSFHLDMRPFNSRYRITSSIFIPRRHILGEVTAIYSSVCWQQNIKLMEITVASKFKSIGIYSAWLFHL